MTILFDATLIVMGILIGYVFGMRHREWTETDPYEWEYTFSEYVFRHVEWSTKTFGPRSIWAQDTERVCRHIEKELKEIRENPYDCEEWIDVIILAIDGAYRSGHQPAAIASALQKKQLTNINRTWVIPDDPTTPIEHDRIEERESNP